MIETGRRWWEQRQQRKLESQLPALTDQLREKLDAILRTRRPRIIVVKQDVNEDLYFAPPGTRGAELVASTLLRSGPAALFAKWDAEFRIVKTVDDPECQVWKERATVLNWDTLEFFRSYRDRVPGFPHGQSSWAIDPGEINWSEYDIVISMDIAVPARITASAPDTLWCYYIREIKTPAYRVSLTEPALGQDLVLNHGFGLSPKNLASHVLEFPYHLHYPGCFHDLFDVPQSRPEARTGVFVDHHTMVALDEKQRQRLKAYGPLASTIHEGEREVIPTSECLPRRTMDADLRERLMNSRYFLITPGMRSVFGTACVEAIAAGCLAIGDPKRMGRHGVFFSPGTTASNVDEAIARMNQLEAAPEKYRAEVERQRMVVDYVAYARPLAALFERYEQKQLSSLRGSKGKLR